MSDQQFIIQGESVLNGEIPVHGAKNSALKMIAASLLSEEDIILHNVPNIAGLKVLLTLLEDIGADIEELKPNSYKINTKNVNQTNLKPELVRKSRSAILLVGPLLARFGEVFFSHPGGCVLGKRPIDFFIQGFQKLGAKVEENEKGYRIYTENGITGGTYFFPRISHTATESMIMTSVLGSGKTVLKNCACEPEVVALCEYLNSVGAKITGYGTHTIEIEGVEKINGGEFTTIPDRLEAGSFAILGAFQGNDVTVTQCNPFHLESLWNIFDQMGVQYELGDDFVRVKGASEYNAVNVMTHEYPGFATDIQPQLTVLLTQALGTSMVHETIFEGRLFYTDILSQMGANIIMCDPHRVVVTGKTPLYGRSITSPDIRAGFALVSAALIAQGETVIDNIHQIDRGHEDVELRLQNLGANIKRITKKTI